MVYQSGPLLHNYRQHPFYPSIWVRAEWMRSTDMDTSAMNTAYFPIHVCIYPKCEISDFFILDNRCKGTRGHSAKLIKIRNNRDALKFFFSRRVIERLNQNRNSTWCMHRALTVLNHIYKKFEKLGWVIYGSRYTL